MPAGASRMAEGRPSISTHVLDTDRGLPARGVRVELYRQGRLVSAQQTNDDGRIADLVQGALEAGVYRLGFHLASPIFSQLEVEVNVADARRHHPIPLVVAPYPFAPYRGSRTHPT